MVLGVKHNASLPDIKRAYAAKIKQHRPDDDPEEFQRIHAAYQSAVDYTKTRSSDAGAHPSGISDWNLLDDYLDYDDEDGSDISETPANIPITPISTENGENDSDKSDWNDMREHRGAGGAHDQVRHRTNNAGINENSPAFGTTNERELDDSEFTHANDIAAGHTAFDFKKFSEEFIDIATNRHATLNSWLENHPDLYDIELKHSLCVPVLELLDEARPLPPKQLLDLLRFFNLDTVTGMGAEFSHEIENLKNKSANAHPWEDLSFIRAPKEQYATTTESDFPWRIIWYGILLSMFAFRALS